MKERLPAALDSVPGAAGSAGVKSEPLRRTIAAVVADRLRIMILQGELPPGERVVVQPLADVFGVSQIPIREALRQLQAEGLVINEPQRGVSVAPMSVQDLLDLYDCRRLIEPEIAVRAVAQPVAATLLELRSALRSLSDAAEDSSSDRYVQEHLAFHWALIAPVQNPVMRRTVQQLWQMSQRYIRLTVASPEHRRVDAQRHEPLVVAMESGEADRIRQEMLRHLSEAQQIIIQRGDPAVVAQEVRQTRG